MTEFTYRRATPEDRAWYIDFINMVFSVAHNPHDFKALLPKAYRDGRGQDDINRLALGPGGEIRGLMALLPGELRVGEQALRTGYVGNVSTHPYGRGEGHMKRLMAMVIDGAMQDGMDLVMLGGRRQRYGYFGFTPGGFRNVYTIDAVNVRHALGDVRSEGIAFVPMAEAAESLIDAAWALHADRPMRAVRRREDFVVTLETWTRTPCVILKDGAFAGYLTASQNGDTLGEVMLSDMADLPAVIKAWILARKPEELSVPAALYDHPLNRALGAFAEDWRMECCQKLRVLNFPRVIRALLPLSAAHRPLPDGCVALWIDGAPLTVAVESGRIAVSEEAPADAPRLTTVEAQELFFSPFAEAQRCAMPAGWLPIPLFIDEADAF